MCVYSRKCCLKPFLFSSSVFSLYITLDSGHRHKTALQKYINSRHVYIFIYLVSLSLKDYIIIII